MKETNSFLVLEIPYFINLSNRARPLNLKYLAQNINNITHYFIGYVTYVTYWCSLRIQLVN